MKALFVTPSGYACIFNGSFEIITCRLHEGRYIRVDDGPRGTYPQLCRGARRNGNTLEYQSPEQLAKDCGARLYATEAQYDEAKQRLREQYEATFAD